MCEILMLLHLLRLSGFVEESGRMAWYTDTFKSCYRSKERSHILLRSRPSGKFVITSDK